MSSIPGHHVVASDIFWSFLINYLWQPASEEKPAEGVQTAPQAEVAPVSWFGNGPTHADLGCDDLFCRVRGGDIPLVEFFLLFLLGFVVGKTRASSVDIFEFFLSSISSFMKCKWMQMMQHNDLVEIFQEHIWTCIHTCPRNGMELTCLQKRVELQLRLAARFWEACRWPDCASSWSSPGVLVLCLGNR